MNDLKVMEQASDNIRILAAAMVEKAKSGHPGGAMGGADFVNVLFTEFLRYDPSDMAWINRDRFFLDPGHMSPMLYAVLRLAGNYSTEDIQNFRQWGSITPGHPEVDFKRGVENTSGPLGQGHTFAVGAAITEKFLQARFGGWMEHKVYAYISDGGVQEEISQGAARIAGHLGLDNLIMFYDANDIQLSTKTSAVTSEDTAAKYRAFGWRVIEIAGNSVNEIRKALREANSVKGAPVIIIGKTVMGKGAVTVEGKSFEGECETHGQPLSKAGASFEKTVQNLGGNPSDPFAVFPETAELYAKAKERLIAEAKKRKEEEKKWREKNVSLATKWDSFFSGKTADIDWSQIQQKDGQSTRAASKTVLAHFAKTIENMIVSSADLSNSDFTDGFLANTKAFTKNDFTGSFLQAGVSELTMAAVANGMALHGGVIPVCATFFVFSDYMKPAVRTAALMELPVKYVWTHDAFRVGEDGPTHQPVEQEAQIRLMEQLKNHNGKNSVLVLRPADSHETTVAWKMAIENKNTPTALLFSRQNIPVIASFADIRRREKAEEAVRGAYIVKNTEKPDVILVANGSEVATILEGAAILEKEKKIKARVVSAISEGVFRNQPADYQEAVLPNSIPTVGLTAGLPVTLIGLVGSKGLVIGLDHFGYSAPYNVLDEKFGFTGISVAGKVVEFLAKIT